MRKGLVLLFACSVVVVSFYQWLWISQSPIEPPQRSHTIEELVESWSDLELVPGLILHVEGADQVLVRVASGHVNLGDSGRRLAVEDAFHTASVGKLFTAVTVLRLHEKGLLDIDEPIASYLEDITLRGLVVMRGRDYWEQITVRHLLSHRSGIGDTDNDLLFGVSIALQPHKVWTVEELLDNARRVGAVNEPGKAVSYASAGYYLLGILIERVTNEPYHQVVRREVFDRLLMNSTFETNKEWKHQLPSLQHYANTTNLSTHDPSFEFADGGFVTTVGDLARFGRALLNRELFSNQKTYEEFINPQLLPDGATSRYALGSSSENTEAGNRVIYHGGAWGVLFAIDTTNEAILIASTAQTRVNLRAFYLNIKSILQEQHSIF